MESLRYYILLTANTNNHISPLTLPGPISVRQSSRKMEILKDLLGFYHNLHTLTLSENENPS